MGGGRGWGKRLVYGAERRRRADWTKNCEGEDEPCVRMNGYSSTKPTPRLSSFSLQSPGIAPGRQRSTGTT